MKRIAMSSSADGILAYGFDLGGGDEWLVKEAGEFGELELDWYNEADDVDEDKDFAEAVTNKLLAAAGFTEANWEVEGYFTRKSAAEKALGARVTSYCSGDCPMYLLSASELRVYQGHVEDAGKAIAATEAIRKEWDAKLQSALEVLGLTPKQEHAKWLLCSDYG